MTIHKHTLPKIIAWSVICIIFSGLFFFVLQESFLTPVFDSRGIVVFISRILLPIIIFSAFLGAVAIHAMIVPGKLYRYITLFFASVTMFLFFEPTSWAVLSWALFFGTLCIYHYTVAGDMHSRLGVHPIYTTAAGLGTVILVLIASVSILYYSSFNQQDYALEEFRTTLRDSIVSTSISAIATQVDGFTEDLTVDQVIANILAGRITIGIIPEFGEVTDTGDAERESQIDQLKSAIELQEGRTISDQELQEVLDVEKQNTEVARVITEQLGEVERQLIDQVRAELSQSISIELQGDETIKEALGRITDRRVISFVEPYLKYAPVIFSASLFFLLYIFSSLYMYLTRGFGMLFYGILRVSHFIELKEEQKKITRITLD